MFTPNWTKTYDKVEQIEKDLGITIPDHVHDPVWLFGKADTAFIEIRPDGKYELSVWNRPNVWKEFQTKIERASLVVISLWGK